MSKHRSYNIIFNNLTRREDSMIPFTDGTIDQEFQILNTAYDKIDSFATATKEVGSKLSKAFGMNKSEKHCLNKSYNDVRISLKQVDLDRIKSSFFNPNKEFKDLTKESAIMSLKQERTFWNAIQLTSSFLFDMKITSIKTDTFQQTFEDKQVNEMIEIIESKNEDELRFHTVIKNANKNNINNTPDSLHLNVDIDNLDDKAILRKLSSIKCESVNIEMVLNKFNLLYIISENIELESALVCVIEQKVYEKVKKNELIKRVNQLKSNDSPFYVKFENFKIEQAKMFIKKVQKPKAEFYFQHLSLKLKTFLQVIVSMKVYATFILIT